MKTKRLGRQRPRNGYSTIAILAVVCVITLVGTSMAGMVASGSMNQSDEMVGQRADYLATTGLESTLALTDNQAIVSGAGSLHNCWTAGYAATTMTVVSVAAASDPLLVGISAQLAAYEKPISQDGWGYAANALNIKVTLTPIAGDNALYPVKALHVVSVATISDGQNGRMLARGQMAATFSPPAWAAFANPASNTKKYVNIDGSLGDISGRWMQTWTNLAVQHTDETTPFVYQREENASTVIHGWPTSPSSIANGGVYVIDGPAGFKLNIDQNITNTASMPKVLIVDGDVDIAAGKTVDVFIIAKGRVNLGYVDHTNRALFGTVNDNNSAIVAAAVDNSSGIQNIATNAQTVSTRLNQLPYFGPLHAHLWEESNAVPTGVGGNPETDQYVATDGGTQNTDQNNPKEAKAFEYAMFAGASDATITLNGAKSFVGGDMHSNGSIIINGASHTVSGAVEANKGIIINGAKNTVGSQDPHSPIIAMPDFSTAIATQATNAGKVYEQSVNLTGTSQTVSSSIYVKGSVTVSGAKFDGTGCILATNSITFNGSRQNASTDDVFCFYSESGNITFNGANSVIDGTIYAPNGSVVFNGANQTVHGRIIAKYIVMNGAKQNVTPSDNDLTFYTASGSGGSGGGTGTVVTLNWQGNTEFNVDSAVTSLAIPPQTATPGSSISITGGTTTATWSTDVTTGSFSGALSLPSGKTPVTFVFIASKGGVSSPSVPITVNRTTQLSITDPATSSKDIGSTSSYTFKGKTSSSAHIGVYSVDSKGAFTKTNDVTADSAGNFSVTLSSFTKKNKSYTVAFQADINGINSPAVQVVVSRS